MARNWIVVGDPTSSGGSVLTGSSFTGIDGLPVARVSDQATCPSHKGAFPIVDGDSTIIIDGQPVALHGSSLACGCKVLSAKQVRAFVEPGAGRGGGEGGGRAVAAMAAAAGVAGALNTAAANESAAGEAAEYDEALRFVNSAGATLAGVDYTLFLESGKTVSGMTDDDGRTGRVATEAPERIVRVELKSRDTACCPLHAERADSRPEALEVKLDSVSTSSNDIGSSVRQIATTEGESRGLTAGEIAMAKLVFGDSVDYARVKVHNGEYLWFGMQPDDTAMTPNGEMYFNSKHFKEDYSNSADLDAQQWFMHEMTHVWQHQLGYPVKWRGALRIGISYTYTLSAERRFCDYNMEAQGNILGDYFVVKYRNRQSAMYEDKYWYEPGVLTLLEVVLSDFLEDPGNKGNLP
ncbi:MAG: PAAR domain-containing protein [Luteimonas sp.]|nr:PAAR domain-containing protein [Luteimonas sp.]